MTAKAKKPEGEAQNRPGIYVIDDEAIDLSVNSQNGSQGSVKNL
jgi:hypothetical protein